MVTSSIFINDTVWKTFTPTEMEEYQQAIFDHYRKTGYPHYVLSYPEKKKQFKSLLEYDHTNLIDDDGVIKQTMHGLALAWSYHPYAWDVQCSGMLTPMQVFNDDTLFKKAIAKRIKYGTYMSDSGMRKALRSFSGTQAVSNFRPTAAAAIYHKFLPAEGGDVWDMSMGFGGRLLGAYACDRVNNYYGTDPNTTATMPYIRMAGEIDTMFEFDPEPLPMGRRTELMRLEMDGVGSEDYSPFPRYGNVADGLYRPIPHSLDLCFTSPPYFDTEKYSDEPTQSYLKYPTKESWLKGFMAKTVVNCWSCLKHGTGHMVINIANVKSYPTLEEDVVKMIMAMGVWEQKPTLKLALSKMMGTRSDNAKFKYEPVFVFRKI
jgi:hypothetical protein